MAEEVVTINEVMEDEKIKQGMDELVAAMEKDAATMKLVEAAETVEDLYQITKRFVKVTIEDFKKVFRQVADYFTTDKTEIADEILDDVVGGWSLSGWFKKAANKLACVAGCIAGVGAFVGGVALGGAIAFLGGPIGLVGGLAVMGAGIAGGTALLYESINMLKNQ